MWAIIDKLREDIVGYTSKPWLPAFMIGNITWYDLAPVGSERVLSGKVVTVRGMQHA